MACTELQLSVMKAIYGDSAVDQTDGNYSWNIAPPSAGIIAAVEALPATATALYNLALATDETGIILQALLTGEQWLALLAWQKTQYESGYSALISTAAWNVLICKTLCATDSALCDEKDATLAAAGYREKG